MSFVYEFSSCRIQSTAVIHENGFKYSGQLMVESVSAAAGRHVTADAGSAQGKISDAVEDFVPNTFVGPSQLIVPHATRGDDHQVFFGQMLPVAHLLRARA